MHKVGGPSDAPDLQPLPWLLLLLEVVVVVGSFAILMSAKLTEVTDCGISRMLIKNRGANFLKGKLFQLLPPSSAKR